MTQTEFQRQYLCEPAPLDSRLYGLVDEYVERCEAYDRTVCSGPITVDGILPVGPHELALINRYAQVARRELCESAARMGFSRADVAHMFKVHRPRSSAR